MRFWLLTSVLALTANAVAAVPAVPEVCANQLAVSRHDCIIQTDPRQSCEAVLAADPKKLTARLSLCDLYLQERDAERAEAVLVDGLATHRGDGVAQNLLNRALSNLAEASSATQRPTNVGVLEDYLILRCKTVRNLEACAEAIDLVPDDPAPYAILADAELAAGKLEDAISLYRQSLALLPDQPEVTRQLEGAIELHEKNRANRLAQCLRGSGRSALAACELASAEAEGRDYTLLEAWGDHLVRADRFTQARQIYGRARDLQPEGTASIKRSVLENLQRCQATSDPAALAACEAVIALGYEQANYPTLSNLAVMRKCRILIDLESVRVARRSCETASELYPGEVATIESWLNDSALNQCTQLQADGEFGAALPICDEARLSQSDPAKVAELDEIIRQLESALADTDDARADALAQARESAQALKSACLAKEGATAAAVAQVCTRALQVNIDDPAITTVLASHVASNAPNQFTAGEYAVTF